MLEANYGPLLLRFVLQSMALFINKTLSYYLDSLNSHSTPLLH